MLGRAAAVAAICAVCIIHASCVPPSSRSGESADYGVACGGSRDCIDACERSDETGSADAYDECNRRMAEANLASSRGAERVRGAVRADIRRTNAGDGSTVGRSTRTLTPQQIAERSLPSIVAISTPTGLGTGFVLSAHEYIVTNLHVIAGDSDIRVKLADGTVHPAVEVRGYHRGADLAILRIDVKGLPSLPLLRTKRFSVGEHVVAIGHPMGLEATVSDGLISALRKLDENVDVIQISAPIAPGSSGGPIFNEHGEVVAVATFVMRGSESLGFGIPARYVVPIARKGKKQSLEAFAKATKAERPTRNKLAELNIAKLPESITTGCSGADLEVASSNVAEVISTARAMCGADRFEVCASLLSGATGDLEHKLSAGCKDLKAELARVKTKARKELDAEKRALGLFADLRAVQLLLGGEGEEQKPGDAEKKSEKDSK